MCFWAIGVLEIIAGITGFIAAHEKSIACCLSPYITLTGLVLAAKSGLLLYLFIAPSKAVDSVIEAWTKSHANDTSPPSPPLDKIHSGIYIGRWVLLGLFALQLLAVLIAVLLRCCAKRAAKQSTKYQPFVEDLESCYNARTAEANAKLAQMKDEVLTAQTLKKNKAGAAYTEMVAATSQDTIAPYRPSASATVSGRTSPLPSRPPPSHPHSVSVAGGARGGAGNSSRAAAGARGAGQTQTHNRSPLGPSSLPGHAPASASILAIHNSTTTSTTRDSFKPTWASKAAGN